MKLGGLPIVGILACAALSGCAAHRLESKLARMKDIAGSHALSGQEKSRELLRDGDPLPAGEFTSNRLSRLSDAQLKDIYNTLHQISIYIEDAPPVYPMEQVFNEMARRKIESIPDVEDLYKQYLVAHLFDKARELTTTYAIQGAAKVPEVIKTQAQVGSSARVFDVSDDAKTLELKSFPAETGPRLVMTVSPVCGPSGRADAAIESDPLLKRLVNDHAIRVTAPGEMRYLEGISQWNRTHPQAKEYVAYKPSDWPGIDLGETPIFYFLKDGKVIKQVTGWPSDDQKQELLKGFAAIGIETPDKPLPKISRP